MAQRDNKRMKLLTGALAGAAGGLLMKALVEVVDPRAFGLSSETDEKSAHAIWQAMAWPPLSNSQARRIGALLHYLFAIATGAAYAETAQRWPAVRTARGAAFGAALWLLGDEVAVCVSGLENPRNTPAKSHVSALVAHVAYGAVLDLSV